MTNNVYANQADELEMGRIRAAGRICEGCGNEIDPETCGCGSRIDHPWDGHSPIPMGCDCGRVTR